EGVSLTWSSASTYSLHGSLALATYLGASGELIHTLDVVADGGIFSRAYMASFPLHEGQFGTFVKMFYLLMGIATACLPLTGIFIWSQRKENLTRVQSFFVRAASALCLGLVVSLGVLLLMSKLASVWWPQGSIEGWLLAGFVSAWMAAAGVVFGSSVHAAAIVRLASLAAVLFLSLPVANALTDGNGLVSNVSMRAPQVLLSEGIFLVLAACLTYAAYLGRHCERAARV
ncbi:MAG: PepSY domain-containing protein, partial [Pseudomonadota bacterium]